MKIFTLYFFISIFTFISFQAKAQESLLNGLAVDATEENWAAMSHSGIDTLHKDACLAVTISSSFRLALRSASEGLEIRTIDEKWSLSPDAQGELIIRTGNYNHTFSMMYFDQNGLTSLTNSDDMKDLLDALSKGTSATLLFGRKTQKIISLAGSRRVLNAFRSCTNASGFANLGAPAGEQNSPF